MSNNIRKLLKLSQFLFLLACLYFLFISFHDSQESLLTIITTAKPGYLLLSFLFWSVLVFIAPWFSHSITRQYQNKITQSDLVQTYIHRLPAKYLPGGIWHTVARGHDLLKKGLTKKQLSFLVFYENFWPVLITALLGGGGVLYYHSDNLWGTTAALLLTTSLIVLLILIVMRKKPWIFPLPTYLAISLISILFWLIAALSFVSYLVAFNLASPNALYFFNYLFSWLIGFLSFFSPQGIGVFELTMTQLTPFPVSTQEAMVIIAGFRLIVLVSDLSNWLIYMVLSKNPGVLSQYVTWTTLFRKR